MKNKTSLFLQLIRFDKPAGTLLLALPCWFGIFLAGKHADNFSVFILLKMLFLFTAGAFLMRSAGCVINDIFDRKIDAKVERTKLRPLASGELKLQEALILLVVLLFAALLILLCLNEYAIGAGFVALALATLYPLMKRITSYPQIFLGLAFNYGILMADLAINERLFVSTMVLFAACVLWSLIYDSIYAFQDIEDDLKIGVKSSAIKFSDRPQQTLASLTAIMFAMIFVVGLMQGFSRYFYLFMMAAFLYELFLIVKCDYSSPSLCLKAFKANVIVGLLILVAIILG